MSLADLYEKHEISEKVSSHKRILVVVPEKGHDITSFLETFLLDPLEVQVTYPKVSDVAIASEIIREELKEAKPEVGVQVDCSFTRKLPSFKDGKPSAGLADRIAKARGPSFVNLHHHDEYSVRDGLGTVDGLLELLKKRRQSFCAITNHGSVGGWIKQYNRCKKEGIKSLFGMEVYVNDYRETDEFA